MRQDGLAHERQDAEAHQSSLMWRPLPQCTDEGCIDPFDKDSILPQPHAQCALSGMRHHTNPQIPPDNPFKYLDMRLCADAQ